MNPLTKRISILIHKVENKRTFKNLEAKVITFDDFEEKLYK